MGHGRGPDEVRFATIDLARHDDVCVAFRRDSFVISDGHDRRFVEQCGADGSGYLSWMEERIAAYPAGNVHLWRGSEIVGQVELSLMPDSTSYVNLFYLAPHARGIGLGEVLHDYATRLFAREGVDTAHLTVSPNNARALRFYARHGWRDVGPSTRGGGRLMRWTAGGPHTGQGRVTTP